MTHTMKFPINNLRLLYKTYLNVRGGEQESGAQEGAAVSALTAQERRRTRGVKEEELRCILLLLLIVLTRNSNIIYCRPATTALGKHKI
jgi:hypothetical protein